MVIGITGKSGSGKSFLAEQLKEKIGGIHVDIDKISHDVLSNTTSQEFVKAEFGETVFENGKINRKKLGQIVFNNKAKLEKLNRFCQAQMEQEIDDIISSNNCPIILDYALLPWLRQFDSIDIKILVSTTFEERFKRVNSRENISKEYFEKRDNSIESYDSFSFDLTLDSSCNIDTEKLIKTINQLGGKND